MKESTSRNLLDVMTTPSHINMTRARIRPLLSGVKAAVTDARRMVYLAGFQRTRYRRQVEGGFYPLCERGDSPLRKGKVVGVKDRQWRFATYYAGRRFTRRPPPANYVSRRLHFLSGHVSIINKQLQDNLRDGCKGWMLCIIMRSHGFAVVQDKPRRSRSLVRAHFPD